MAPAEVERILAPLLPKESIPFDAPSEPDWQTLETRFSCHFGDDFKAFIALMSKYQFPGDILNVSSGKTNGNDSIELTYELESRYSVWDAAMIPFYAIGNGDYFCLNSKECPNSRVFYYYAERQSFEPYSDSFAKWVQQLPEFLV